MKKKIFYVYTQSQIIITSSIIKSYATTTKIKNEVNESRRMNETQKSKLKMGQY